MTPDISLALGLLIFVFTIPAIFSAVVDGRVPRAPALMAAIGGVFITWAILQKPGGYTLEEIPQVLMGVLAQLIR